MERNKQILKSTQTLTLTITAALLLIAAADDLDYRSRGNRSEGARPKPVGGYDLVLVGAMVEGGVPAPAQLPKDLELRFYLKDKRDVHLTIREREAETYYWLDEVEQSWRRGVNVFSWPSAEVVGPLEVSLANLTVLARLDSALTDGVDEVAPVVFPQRFVPKPVERYRFTFKCNSRARVGWKLFRGNATEPIAQQTERRISAGLFDVEWNAGRQPAGRYRLKVEGYFLNDNEPIDQVVLFDHRPDW